MAIVYLVTSGDGSDGNEYANEEIFSTHEKAWKFIGSIEDRNTEDWDVEEWDVK